MTHILPPHAELSLSHSSLQTALQIDPNQQPPPTPQQQPQNSPSTPVAQPQSRKRRKVNENGDEAPHPAEPRRLRRSHEACARCRSKKIKCDSKHPRCTACATAGTPCHQEDRHRQTLTPRGHTERIERQLIQCDALLKRYIANFDLNELDSILAREGIDIDTSDNAISNTFQFTPNSPQSGPSRGFPLRTEGPPMGGSPPRGYPYPVPPPGQPMMPPGYHGPMPVHYPPYGPPPHPHMMGPPPPGYDPRNMVPPFQHPLGPPGVPQRAPSPHEIRGQDPHSHDMSNTQALAKTFGVASAIMNDVTIPPTDKEDLAVGSSGLTSGRDRAEAAMPRDTSKWISVTMRRNSLSVPPPEGSPPMQSPPVSTNVAIWLPKSQETVQIILRAYFDRLNYHRPVLMRTDFETTLAKLYKGEVVPHDPGYVCCTYLVLALGTLSELNHRVSQLESSGQSAASVGSNMKALMPQDWPDHEEFFQLALSVKPDLRVTVSSLQALILLHWYLYTEGRTLWRLVGSLVRLAIELGLHHDPTSQDNVFSPEECQLRIRLWGIVLMHDRGTSILLGRPLAIAPSDSNTPRPGGAKGSGVSEHFVLNAPIAEIQADIINSLYAPTRQTADSIMRHANRIIKSMVVFRKQLPDHYKWFFSGTLEWPVERRTKLVADISEDEGLTLLKIGITKVLLLRALFSSKELEYSQRHRALVDAIVTSHNIIVVHNQLIQFPDIAFFVSPIPLHIAAMVILYGHMSKCDRIPHQVALEDVWMALDMLPSFRWRWERKDLNGGHPLIAKLAEKVLDVNLHQVAPTGVPVLLPEQDWESEGILSPKSKPAAPQGQSPTTPKMGPAQYGSVQGGMYPGGPGGGGGGGGGPGGAGGGGVQVKGSPGSHNGDLHGGGQPKMPDLPPYYFYPFYAEGGNGGAAPNIAYTYPTGQDQYVLEEKDAPMAPAMNTMQMQQPWGANGSANGNGNGNGQGRPSGPPQQQQFGPQTPHQS